MLPIKDDAPRSTTPYVNYFLIGLNIFVFLFEYALSSRELRALVGHFGLVPIQVTRWLQGEVPADVAIVPVLTWVFVAVIQLPAWLVLGYWFLAQLLSGAATAIAYSHETGGGVAVWAHVGGFITGVILIKLFPLRPTYYSYEPYS